MIHGGYQVFELKTLKYKIAMSYTVGARAFYARKSTIISSPKAGHLFDVIIVALHLNSYSTDPSRYLHRCWKSVGNCCQLP